MALRFFPLLRRLALFLALTPTLPLAAQLVSQSPFLPPAGEAATAEVAPVLEFRGYIADAEGVRFRVNATNRNTGAWVRLNERNPDLNLVAKQHDAARDTLVVEYDGRTQALTQRKSKIVSTGLVATTPMTTAMPTGTVVMNGRTLSIVPTPVVPPVANDAQKGLEDLAASVAARRAARGLPAPATPPPAKR